jgi:hypothetical protein
MQRFKSLEQAQTFLSAHAFIHGHFHPPPSPDSRRIPRNPVDRF